MCIKKYLTKILSLILLCFIIFTVLITINYMYTTTTQKDTLIPRDIIFDNPSKANVQISPNGEYISYLAPDMNGVLNIWIAPVNQITAAQCITSDTHRGIRMYHWDYNNNIVFAKDNNGDENYHLYTINIKSLEEKDITPFSEVIATIEALNKDYPDYAIIEMNHRRKDFFDLYLVNLKNGELKLIYENNEFLSF